MTIHHSRKSSVIIMFLLTTLMTILFTSCEKNNEHNQKNPSAYSGDVVDKWMTLQLRLMKNATGIPNHGFSRQFAYTGIAALLSVEPSYQIYNKWKVEWNGLTGLPAKPKSNQVYYPANANAALAAMNRLMFPNASVADKSAIDSLEQALKQEFLSTVAAAVIDFSTEYGYAVADAVYAWAETDGYKKANDPFTPKAGPGYWKPTPPAFANAATPHWGNNRPVIVGSTRNAEPVRPPVYSTQAGTPFYEMAKEVHEASKNLAEDQVNMANYWRDVPGVSSPGHWLSILQQVIHKEKTNLADAVLAYALTGAAINDALIACFKTKYEVSLVRPVTYIREVIGVDNWSPILGTPAHPEYPSAHSSLSVAAGVTMEKLFGKNKSFTDHTYDYLGYPSRTYPSYEAIGIEAGRSRLYAGIHYQFSIDAGTWQGKKVAENIFSK